MKKKTAKRKGGVRRGGAVEEEDAPMDTPETTAQTPPRVEVGNVLPRPKSDRIAMGAPGGRRAPRTTDTEANPPVLMRPGPPPRPDVGPPPAPPQVPLGAELIRKELDALVREISEGVRRTIGDVSEADRVTEINEHLVRFVTGTMQALAKLLEHLETYNRQLTEVMRDLNAFNAQINGKGAGARAERAARDAVGRLSEFRSMVSKSLDGMKKYLRPEDMVPLQQALGSWEQLLKVTPTQEKKEKT